MYSVEMIYETEIQWNTDNTGLDKFSQILLYQRDSTDLTVNGERMSGERLFLAD